MSERLKNVRRGDIPEEKRAFVEEFRGPGWQVDSILESLLESDDFYCEVQSLVKLDSWSRGRATLAGDAGYCSAASGQGTSCAMVGAYVLAGEIGRHVGKANSKGTSKDEDVKIALEAYERKFRPLVNQVQKGVGEENIFDKIQWKRWQIRILYWVMWLASLVRLDKLAVWFTDFGVKGWELTEYEELKD
ncbi:Fc.00g029820.m01.CDS01 [Cosmosporella sp. VM-42]